MKSYARPAFAGISIAAMLAAIAVAGAQKPALPKAGAYAKVDKVVQAKCIGCHQGARAAAGVNLASYDTVVKGKWQGKPLVVAKNAKASVLANSLHGTGMKKMPLGGNLTDPEIKTIESWIAAGAKK